MTVEELKLILTTLEGVTDSAFWVVIWYLSIDILNSVLTFIATLVGVLALYKLLSSLIKNQQKY